MSTDTRPSRINVMEFAGKAHLLGVVRSERAAFYDLIDGAVAGEWEASTPCGEWQVRDLVGHMVDVTEAYLERFGLARAGKPAPEALGLRVMPKLLDEGARRFRAVPRAQIIARLKGASDEMFGLFDKLDAQQWGGEMVAHVYMGPVPACFYPAFQLMDYSVHGWDAREALGRSAPIPEDAAGTLIPFMFILLQATLAAERAEGLACTCGIRVSGVYGGSWRVSVAGGALSYEEGGIDDCPATFSFDASDFVLTCFQRLSGGLVSGDNALAERFRGLFFKI
ncbi:MAG TPA: maleylpyruvate isomerase family mycothiol-dependent enzyme [Chloroflexota bacterium]|nr:maleylpyruvate isomerase family mycothiol-dependent enzyme [Chloroflexota bacterium]